MTIESIKKELDNASRDMLYNRLDHFNKFITLSKEESDKVKVARILVEYIEDKLK